MTGEYPLDPAPSPSEEMSLEARWEQSLRDIVAGRGRAQTIAANLLADWEAKKSEGGSPLSRKKGSS